MKYSKIKERWSKWRNRCLLFQIYYVDHEVEPYISPDRNLGAWLVDPKPVSKRKMELLQDSLLEGDIILLWRINFGTFTTETWFPKYFEYTYGIHAPEHVKVLVDKGMPISNQLLIRWTTSMRPWKKPFSKRKESLACPRWKRPIWTKLWLITLQRKS